METEKKTPEEEKKLAPAAEQKDEPKPEEKPAENKQTDDNGTAEKPLYLISWFITAFCRLWADTLRHSLFPPFQP